MTFSQSLWKDMTPLHSSAKGMCMSDGVGEAKKAL